MKESLAKAIAEEWDTNNWQHFVDEMNNQTTKDRYRGLLQQFGEYFTLIDNSHWIERVMRKMQSDVQRVRFTEHCVEDPPGTVYDSIRTPAEIRGVRAVYPDAKRVHLLISHARQVDFLRQLGRSTAQAEDVLAHTSEHWLDDCPPDCAPDILLDAEYGDDSVYHQFQYSVLGD